MFTEVFVEFITPIVLAVAGLLGYLTAKFLKQYIDKNTFEQKKELVDIAVRFVEQVYKNYNGEQKLNEAINWLTKEAKRLGLTFSEDEMRAMIEAVVKSYKDQFSKQW